MDHPLYQQACQLIDQSKLRRISVQLKHLIKPAIRIESQLCPAHSLPLGASKLGGFPDLPPSLAWPTCQGVPMVFLAQICLVDVLPYDLEHLLPTHGFLFFFCQSQGLSQGVEIKVWDYVDPYAPESWKVLFFDGTKGELHATDAPQGLAQKALLPPCALRFGHTLSLPPIESSPISMLHLEKEERKPYLDLLWTFAEAFSGVGDNVYHHHHLLGYPQQFQEDMQLLCQVASLQIKPSQWTCLTEEAKASIKTRSQEWLHLLTIDTDEYAQITWGENGCFSYWIKQTDLRQRKFEGCWGLMDSL